MNTTLGIDFGTTNSALAWTNDSGEVEVASFSVGDEPLTTFRSILYCEADPEPYLKPQHWCGPAAITQYLSSDEEGRLMQSMKTFLASKHVKSTSVFGHDHSLEHLISLIISGLSGASGRAEVGPDGQGPKVIAGRPVRFANADSTEDDDYAEARLRMAFKASGFEDVEFVLEPVAAALHYEAALAHDEVVLVADFGGGTSDFCLMRAGPSFKGDLRSSKRILGTRGIGVAGDNLDARIVQRLVWPALGAGSQYRSMMGKMLDIPISIYEKLRRWNELSFLKTPRNMSMLMGYARTAAKPELLDALIHLVEENLGYELYRAVEAAKVDLTANDTAVLRFSNGPIDIKAPFSRSEFESWIEPELASFDTTVAELLAEANVSVDDVDAVFLTGGTAQVRAVRALFAARFGESKLRSGSYLTSIARGLAHYGGQV